jgi:hypothetical protein
VALKKGWFVRVDAKEERGRSWENGIWVTEKSFTLSALRGYSLHMII